MHRMVTDKKNDLALLEKDMKRAEGEERIVSKDSGGANFEYEKAQAELDYYEEQHDF
jgi:precorrin-6x reductase